MLLVRDVLDVQILDRDRAKMGKVDGMVLELREGKPPRVVYLEVGVTTLARRLGRRIGRMAQGLARRWGGPNASASRIAWTRVREVGIDVQVDEDCEESGVYALEDWLRIHVVERLPGGKPGKEKRR